MGKVINIDFNQKLIAKEELPLFGKHILITSPRNYAGILVKYLVERGAKPVWMPTIEIEPVKDYHALDNAINGLSGYDWVGFSSRNGIEAFFKRLNVLKINPQEAFRKTKTCAIGADSEALESRGITPDLIPEEASTEGIVEEMKRRNIKSGRILLPVPEVIGMKEPRIVPEFVARLKRLGMDVERIPAYTTAPVKNGYDLEKKMLINCEIDVVTFTSSAEVDSMLSILGNRKEALNSTTIACVGPYTGATAKNMGLDVKIMPENNFSSFHCLIEEMERYFGK
ncbi:MAG: uroporphyrinogen-III synthase [Candidatus Schekmanbacteria bacterium]|nr:uroporphyrinogen-III synthase [Candidatus Schekmanbacteria bacterium]